MLLSLSQPGYAGPSARIPVPMSPGMRAHGHSYPGRNKGTVLLHNKLNHNTLQTKPCNATQ
ncbi:hypothetical protein IA74_004425 [Bacteroides fragilis]|uniref:Uncharacterized protein n=1 Tax=Bacteroides fragilis TaxID=817 RepID=A0AAP8ZS70_BACFG|nr:hypothetical protein IA74_004425 [Bacteroides fragilis]